MEKIQLDEQNFINVYSLEDFLDEKVSSGIIKSCEKIISSHKEDFDTETLINDFKDKNADFFLDANLDKAFAFVLYTKEGCDAGKRKALSYAYFTKKKDREIWELEMFFNKKESQSSVKKLMVNSFEYLKNQKIEKVNAIIEEKNKDLLEVFDNLLGNNSIVGEKYYVNDEISSDFRVKGNPLCYKFKLSTFTKSAYSADASGINDHDLIF